MNQTTLIKNIHLGIKKTNELYESWTGGWWLTAYGVEHFMVGNVARLIMEQKDSPAHAFLELSFGEMYADAGKSLSKESEENKSGNRVDLAFCHRNLQVQYVVEFKKLWNLRGFEHDAARLAGLLDVLGTGKGGPLTCAVFTCLVWVSGNSEEETLEKLREKIEKCTKSCEEHVATKLRGKVTSCQVTSSLDYEDIGPVLLTDGTQAQASLCVRMTNSR